MDSGTFSRRAFLKAMLAALITAGCAPVSRPNTEMTPGPSLLSGILPRPTPTLTPTPLPSADGVVDTYLAAWQQQDLGAMYALLTPDSQQRTSASDFEIIHRHVLEQTTTLSLAVKRQSLLVEGTQATAAFHTVWHTSLFNVIETDHSMLLRFVNGNWRVVWEPTLLLPQMGYGVTLALLEETVARGDIVDAQTQALATNVQVITVGVVPGQIEDRARLISSLGPVLGLDAAEIKAKISAARPDWFVPLGDIDFDTSVQYLDLLSSLKGVERRPHPARSYPHGETGAHIVGTLGGISAAQLDSYRSQGYRGDELVGQTGIEGWGEPFLAGKRGGRLVTFSPAGKEMAELASAPARPGGNIYLNLDVALQQRAEEILGARRGSIVVMTPTGTVKAMASYPRFNPQLFATGIDAQAWASLLNNPDRPLINRPAQGTYPPASVFKIISMAAAIEKLGMSPNTTFTCNGIWYGLGKDFPKSCWLKTGHGVISLQDGLTQSCDVVFYEVGKALFEKDPTLLPSMARAFGLGQPTGIMGIDEASGIVPDDTWKQATLNEPFFVGDAVNMAIGQGYVLATPLQIARMIAALSANAQLSRPQLVRQLSSRDAGDQFFPPEVVGALPVAATTLATIQQAMIGVAHGRRGTARKAFEGVGFTVAGKTGTAETVTDAPHAWFAGYTPAENPQVIIVVMLENAGEGSEKAAPLFRLLAESYFQMTNDG